MIKLFYTHINYISDDFTLANWQKRKAAVYKKREDCLRCVAGSLLINTVLFNGLPAPAPSLGSYGKPCFLGAPDFNLSHAGDFAVLAVDSLPVGIDIEQKTEADYLSMGGVFLCKEEYLLLEQSPDKCSLFYDLWTRKESYLKMAGTGLHRDPKSFSVLHDPPGCHFFMRTLSPGYAVTVCSSSCACAPDFIRLDF